MVCLNLSLLRVLSTTQVICITFYNPKIGYEQDWELHNL